MPKFVYPLINAISGVSRLYYYGNDLDLENKGKFESKNVGYPSHGHEDYYAQMHDTYNLYPYAFGFCEDKWTVNSYLPESSA